MFIEILIALLLFTIAMYILYKNIRKKSSGKCDCGSCSAHCPSYEKTSKKTDLPKTPKHRN